MSATIEPVVSKKCRETSGIVRLVLRVTSLTCSCTALALVSAGCASSPEYLNVSKDPDPDSAKPPALWAWSESGDLRVLYVHGMANRPFGVEKNTGLPDYCGFHCYRDVNGALAMWDSQSALFRETVETKAEAYQGSSFSDSFARAFGYKEDKKSDPAFRILTSDTGEVLGYLFLRHYEKPRADGNGSVHLTIYTVCWAMPAAVEKESQLGSFDGHTIPGKFGDFDHFLDRYRHALNRTLKLSTIDWGLGDASLYLQQGFGGKFRWAVAKGMDELASDLQTGDHVAIVTASLGSTITLDTISALLGNSAELYLGHTWEWSARAKPKLQALFTPRSIGSAPVAFYMFANQYALLSLGRDERASSQKQDPVKKLDRVLDVLPAPRDVTPTGPAAIQLVAFTDPDDLLSFPVNSKGLHDIAVCNVYVRNPNQHYHLSATMDVTLPDKAHENYEINPIVLDIMKSGQFPSAAQR